jgi:hypothetical protein
MGGGVEDEEDMVVAMGNKRIIISVQVSLLFFVVGKRSFFVDSEDGLSVYQTNNMCPSSSSR